MNNGQVGGFSTQLDVTPVISTSAYTSGDQIGGIQTLAVLSQASKVLDAPCQKKNATSFLSSLVVIDAAGQNSPMTAYFFNALPTVVSVDNGVLNISAAELQAKCIGFAEVQGTDWKFVGSVGVATLNMSKSGVALQSNTEDGPLYVIVQADGTPTYVATSDLTFKYLFSQDLGNGHS